MGIVLSKPVEMLKINIVTPKEYVEDIVSHLQQLGVIHITKTGEGMEYYRELFKKLQNIHEKIDSILSYLRGKTIDVELSLIELETLTIDTIEDDVNKVYMDIETKNEQIRVLEKKISETKAFLSILEKMPRHIKPEILNYDGKHVVSKTLIGRKDSFKHLFKEEYFIKYIETPINEEEAVVVITNKKYYNKLREATTTLGIRTLELPRELYRLGSLGEIVDNLRKQLDKLDSEYKELKEAVRKIINESSSDIAKYKVIVENMLSKVKTLLETAKSKYLIIVSGWTPKKKSQYIKETLEKRKLPVYIEYTIPDDRDEPPTLLENPPVLRFFEPIVKFIGAPSYREWDPTPIIAYSFSLFYGLMLGDIGYALAIILAVYLVLDKFVVNPEDRDYVYFKNALVLSSLVGLVVGLLSGTFFGDTLSKFFGIKFSVTTAFTDPLEFLKAALIIGLIHVNIAHAISLVKNYKLRNIGDVVSEIGIFIAEIFGIPYILYTMLNTSLPGIPEQAYSYMLYGAFFGVALIVIGKIKSLGGLGILMSLFDLTGLLGDVLSYSRLAGVGLATIYLASSFNMMASMIYGGLTGMMPGTIGEILGFIAALIAALFGHIVNMALSALGSFIHSLRLCFVEFLSKFYEGTGYLFNPFKVVVKTKLVIE